MKKTSTRPTHKNKLRFERVDLCAARGLTFIEMLVTIAVFGIIMTAIVTSVLFFYQANTSSLEQGFQIENARKGVQALVGDLRETVHGDSGAYPIAAMASTSITFYSDIDADPAIERVHYTLSGTELFRHTLEASGTPPTYAGAGATSTVSIYVRNEEEGVPIFRYYDHDGVLITDYSRVGDVRSVVIDLIVNIQPIRAPQEFTLRSSATLRNLRD